MRWGTLLLAAALAVGCQKHDAHDGHGHDEPAGHGARDEHDEPAGHDAHEGHDEHREGEEESVRIAPEALARSDIRLGAAEAGALAAAIEVPAEVQLNPDRVAHVSPLVEGQLISVDVTLGDTVELGQPLARLRSVELGQARAALSRATALRQVARQTRDRQKRLRAEGISAERSLIEAQLAYDQAGAERDAALSRLKVFGLQGGSGPDMALESPIAGRVVERHATRGENVSPDDTLFVVADLTRVWIIGRVYEQQVAQVAVGMAASLTLGAYPGRRWEGKVDFVGATLDEATRSLPIRMEVDNPDGQLRPGLFGSLYLATDAPTAEGLVVPVGAVQTLEGRSVVFVPGEGAGVFEARMVTVGREAQGQVEIVGGLAAGARVVVEGAFLIKSELMRGQLGHGHAH